jgi:hypothetical protein
MVVCLLSDLFFWLVSNIFSIMMHIKLGLPHPLTFGLSHCICGQPLDLMGSIFFVVPMVGKRQLPMMLCRITLNLLWKILDFTSYELTNPRSFITCLLVLTWMGWHCGFNGWCLDVGWRCHHWPHLNWFRFTSNFILQGCYSIIST